MAKKKPKKAAAPAAVRRTPFQLQAAAKVAAARGKAAEDAAYQAAKLAQNARGAFARANTNPTADNLYQAAKTVQNARGAAARAADAIKKAKNSKVKLKPSTVRAVQSVVATTGLKVDQATDDALGVAYGQATGDVSATGQLTDQGKKKKKKGGLKLKLPKSVGKLLKKAVSFVPGGTTLSNVVAFALDNKGRLPAKLVGRKKKKAPGAEPEIGVVGDFPPSSNDANGDGVNDDGTLTQAATVAVNTGNAKPPEPLVNTAIAEGTLPPEAATAPASVVNRPQPIKPVLIDQGGEGFPEGPSPQMLVNMPTPGRPASMPQLPVQVETPEPAQPRQPITGPIYDGGTGPMAQPGGMDLAQASAPLDTGDKIMGLPKPVVYIGGAVALGLVLVLATSGGRQPQYAPRGR